jgi:hypothetical protein
MIRTSNSSMVNFDKNSLSTVYWIGSFFSKLYRPPCFSYLFSTYANRLIQYTCLRCFFSIIKWLWQAPQDFHLSHSDGRTVSYGCIIILIYRSWQQPFQQLFTDHWRGRSPVFPPFAGHSVPVCRLTAYQTYLIIVFSCQRTPDCICQSMKIHYLANGLS